MKTETLIYQYNQEAKEGILWSLKLTNMPQSLHYNKKKHLFPSVQTITAKEVYGIFKLSSMNQMSTVNKEA